MICNKCNAPVQEGEKFCPGCGNDLVVNPPVHGDVGGQPVVNNENVNVGRQVNSVPVQDKVNVWLVILSWFIPLAGLIIFFVKKDSSPKTAKASGLCALISVLLSVIVTVASFVLFFGAFNAINNEAKEDMNTMIEDVFDQAEEIIDETEDKIDENNSNSADSSTTNLNISNDWKQYQIGIKGKIYTLPMTYNGIAMATGFSLKGEYINMVLPNNHYALVNLYKNDKLSLYIELYNNSGVEAKYIDSKVTRVSQTKYQLSQGAEAVVFPGGIRVGDFITEAQLISLFGEANDVKDYGTRKQYLYVSDATWTTTNNFKIIVVDGVIDEIQLDNRK